MTRKINSFVCDKCRVCCPAGNDEYPIENGWKTVYHDHLANEPTEHFCPKCTHSAILIAVEKIGGEK
jgi:hypothetical protein